MHITKLSDGYFLYIEEKNQKQRENRLHINLTSDQLEHNTNWHTIPDCGADYDLTKGNEAILSLEGF